MLIAMPKRVPIKDIGSDTEPPKSTRTNAGLRRRMFSVDPEDGNDKHRFQIELCRDRHAFAIILHAKTPPKPWQAIFRCDVQDHGHYNPERYGGAYIQPGQLHYHRYNEQCERDYGLWSKVADLIDHGGTRQLSEGQEIQRLTGEFYRMTNIRFTESAGVEDLFGQGL